MIYVYPEDPLYRILARRVKGTSSNFVTHEGHVYEHITQAENCYFKGVAVEPNPELFDHEIDLGLYFTGNYSQD